MSGLLNILCASIFTAIAMMNPSISSKDDEYSLSILYCILLIVAVCCMASSFGSSLTKEDTTTTRSSPNIVQNKPNGASVDNNDMMMKTDMEVSDTNPGNDSAVSSSTGSSSVIEGFIETYEQLSENDYYLLGDTVNNIIYINDKKCKDCKCGRRIKNL
jgi:ABC-type transport system involved in multi-copper enzyme maturation permease subunit